MITALPIEKTFFIFKYYWEILLLLIRIENPRIFHLNESTISNDNQWNQVRIVNINKRRERRRENRDLLRRKERKNEEKIEDERMMDVDLEDISNMTKEENTYNDVNWIIIDVPFFWMISWKHESGFPIEKIKKSIDK